MEGREGGGSATQKLAVKYFYIVEQKIVGMVSGQTSNPN